MIVYAGSMEIVTPNNGGASTIKTYWPDGLGVEIDAPNASTTLNWTHTDNLGSVVAVTGSTGNLEESMAYDPWGARRDLPGNANELKNYQEIVDNKGFTDQEMLDQLNLVHLNGRIYDPLVGRFISADPEIQDPTHSQSYNRYAYVWDNPTNQTDPSGFEATKAQVDAAIASGHFTFADNGLLMDVTIQGFDGVGNQVSLTASSLGNFTTAVEIYAAHGSSISVSMLSPAALVAKTSSNSQFGPSAGDSDRWGGAKSRDDIPQGLKKFKKKYPLMDVLESKIWSDSQPNTTSAHEQGLLGFVSPSGENPIFVVEYYKSAYVPKTGEYSHIPMPDYDTMFAELHAKYDIPRDYSFFVEEHTHPFSTAYVPFMRHLERGPSVGPNSDESFAKLKGYNNAYHIVQGMDPRGSREFFYYGDRAMNDW